MLHRTSWWRLSVWRKRLPRGIESELITGIGGCEGKEDDEEGSILITTSAILKVLHPDFIKKNL